MEDASDTTQSRGNPNIKTTDQVKMKLREDRKGETDTEVLYELKSDIENLKKKRDEWATLLGMNEE